MNISIKLLNDHQGYLNWATDAHRYTFTFDSRDGLAPPRALWRHSFKNPAVSRDVNPEIEPHRSLVERALAYAQEHELLKKALEMHTAKDVAEQIAKNNRARTQAIEKHSCEIYFLLKNLAAIGVPGVREVLDKIAADL